jgi:hypothetical protein
MGVEINANPNAPVIPVSLSDAIAIGSTLSGQALAYANAAAASAALADADRIAAQAAVTDAANASRLTISTTTLSPGATPTASITGPAGAQVLNLGLSTGATGAAGAAGAAGATGASGPQGAAIPTYATSAAGVDTGLKTALSGNIVPGAGGTNGSYNVTIVSPNGGTSAVIAVTVSGGAVTAATASTAGTRFLAPVTITNAQIVAAGATGLTGAQVICLNGGGVDFGQDFAVVSATPGVAYNIFTNVSGAATATSRLIMNGDPALITNNVSALVNGSEDDPAWLYAVTDLQDRIVIGARKTDGALILPTYTPRMSPLAFPDVLHFVGVGQSLMEGSESFLSTGGVISTAAPAWGNLRFNRGIRTWSVTGLDPAVRYPQNRPASGFSFVSQNASATGLLGETIGVGIASSLKAGVSSPYAIRSQVGQSPQIIFSTAARGATRLTGVNKEDTGNTTYGTSTTSLTSGVGSMSLTTQTGLDLLPGDLIAIARNDIGGYDWTPYMSGSVTSYNSGTGALVFNSVAASSAGVTLSNWRIVRDSFQYPGAWYPTNIDDVSRARASAIASGLTYGVGGIVFMQGERNNDLKIYEYDRATSPLSTCISDYRTRLIQLANDYDADIRAITEQPRRVPFFTYQTESQPAAQGQLDASAATPSIIMVGPHYACPSAINGSEIGGGAATWGSAIHKSADGSRMYGEMFAKVIRRVLFEKEQWRGLRPSSAVKIDAVTFDVTFEVPRPPLVLDTTFLARAQGWGFRVRAGTVDSPTATILITNAVLVGPTTVRFTAASALPSGAWVESGYTSVCDLGTVLSVLSVGTGANTPIGQPTHTITIAGDQRALLRPLSDEGAFYATQGGFSAVIRSVVFNGTNTVLTGETRERSGAFSTGAIEFGRAYLYTNLRDSDNEASIHAFVDAGYTARLGQPYPMWNWCCAFTAFQISGA